MYKINTNIYVNSYNNKNAIGIMYNQIALFA